jgi:hypothetical protein
MSEFFIDSCSHHLLFYIVERVTETKVGYVLRIYYHTSFQDSVRSGTSVAATSQVPASNVLVLPVVGN